ncbi:GNAT family N-acetyltransferase [Nonomuraea salmonea]|uniref:GNAT family N-acetyltransferase n=1 Tax=Nonomuraea salmonea TaxID=46181 RepID=A0ABV5P2V7_9ACTN
MISVRRATPDDATTVHGLMRGLADHQHQGSALTVTPGKLKELLGQAEVGYLIAERDGRAIGYVSWLERTSFWSGEDYLHLDDLYVAAGERGDRVGERLMHAIAAVAAGRVIRWEVAEANVGAQRFYERIGATLITKKIGRWRP